MRFFSLFIGVMLLAFSILTSCQKDSNDEPQKPQTGNNGKPDNNGKPNNGGGNNNGGYTPIPDVPKVNVEPLIYNFNQKLKDVKKNYKFTPSIEISDVFPFEKTLIREENKRTLVLDTNIKGTFEVRLHQIRKVTNDGELKNGAYTIRGVRGTYPMRNLEFFLFSRVEVIITTETGETISSTIQNEEKHKYLPIFEIEYKHISLWIDLIEDDNFQTIFISDLKFNKVIEISNIIDCNQSFETYTVSVKLSKL